MNNLSLVLLLVTVFTMETNEVYTVRADNIQPYQNCVDCGTLTIPQCLKQNIYSYTTSCKRSSSCSVKVYKSRSAEICRNCGKYVAYYSYHECVEVHSSCSKGTVSTCTIGYWPLSILEKVCTDKPTEASLTKIEAISILEKGCAHKH